MARVVFAPEAEAQLEALYLHIAREGSPATAERFLSAIIDRCEALAHMPLRGRPKDDLRPGLRTLSFRRRAVIATWSNLAA